MPVKHARLATAVAKPITTPHGDQVLNRVAVVLWQPVDGMAQAIADALLQLGYDVVPFVWNQPLPQGVDAVFSQGPYGRFLSVPNQLEQLPLHKRPLLVHWNDEGMPDLRLPWPVLSGLGRLRSWVGRQVHAARPNWLARLPGLRWMDRRMKRFSYL